MKRIKGKWGCRMSKKWQGRVGTKRGGDVGKGSSSSLPPLILSPHPPSADKKEEKSAEWVLSMKGACLTKDILHPLIADGVFASATEDLVNSKFLNPPPRDERLAIKAPMESYDRRGGKFIARWQAPEDLTSYWSLRSRSLSIILGAIHLLRLIHWLLVLFLRPKISELRFMFRSTIHSVASVMSWREKKNLFGEGKASKGRMKYDQGWFSWWSERKRVSSWERLLN